MSGSYGRQQASTKGSDAAAYSMQVVVKVRNPDTPLGITKLLTILEGDGIVMQ